MLLGLQAAVREAGVWFGGGSNVLGRALQVGPHSYVRMSLFPSDRELEFEVPPMQTPFQVGNQSHQHMEFTYISKSGRPRCRSMADPCGGEFQAFLPSSRVQRHTHCYSHGSVRLD